MRHPPSNLPSVVQSLAAGAVRHPDRIAFTDDQSSITYGELAQRVAGISNWLAPRADRVGLLAENSIDWVAADLASIAAGVTLVPLPTFFSAEQLTHIVQDAQLDMILTDDTYTDQASALSTAEHIPQLRASVSGLGANGNARRIIYTSGSTGHPKGVRLGNRQLDWSGQALARAILANADDVYLSILPFALLLEELCAIHVPLLVGGVSHIRAQTAAACAAGDLDAIRLTAEAVMPSVTVLVPDLLRAWVASLALSDTRAPDSLRFVAAGGAPVPVPLSTVAADLGLPVYEGYGLSETCSVVSVNQIGNNAPGTAGSPLLGLDVSIEDGEIIVRGPSVMDGYLHASETDGVWQTGDLGHFDETGRLVIEGRRDSRLTTAGGRNISPEWVETHLLGDPRIQRAILTLDPGSDCCAILTPSFLAAGWADNPPTEELAAALREACAELPEYAQPRSALITADAELRSNDLLTANGRPRRKLVREFVAAQSNQIRMFAHDGRQ